MVLTRFNSDGSVDTTFGVNGLAIADFGTRSTAVDSQGGDLIQQFDGKLVAVGYNTRVTMGAARFDDNAAFPGRIGLTETRQWVDETSDTVTYTVRRTGGTTGAVTVEFATVAGTAQPRSDFKGENRTLSWNDGDVRDKTITIDLIDDVDSESLEHFTHCCRIRQGTPSLLPATRQPGLRAKMDLVRCIFNLRLTYECLRNSAANEYPSGLQWSV